MRKTPFHVHRSVYIFFLAPLLSTVVFAVFTLLVPPELTILVTFHAILAGICIYTYIRLIPVFAPYSWICALSGTIFLLISAFTGFQLSTLLIFLCFIIGSIAFIRVK